MLIVNALCIVFWYCTWLIYYSVFKWHPHLEENEEEYFTKFCFPLQKFCLYYHKYILKKIWLSSQYSRVPWPYDLGRHNFSWPCENFWGRRLATTIWYKIFENFSLGKQTIITTLFTNLLILHLSSPCF